MASIDDCIIDQVAWLLSHNEEERLLQIEQAVYGIPAGGLANLETTLHWVEFLCDHTDWHKDATCVTCEQYAAVKAAALAIFE